MQVLKKLTTEKANVNVVAAPEIERTIMSISNRFGDSLDKESREASSAGGSGLLGPDGQPLPSTDADSADQGPEPQLDFFNYIASLSYQAMIFLGEVPNPITNQTEKNLKQAKFLIDTLILLKEKTVGNLSKEEAELINNSVYELQRRFVEVSQKEK